MILMMIVIIKFNARYGPGRQSRQQSLVKLGQLQQVPMMMMMINILIYTDIHILIYIYYILSNDHDDDYPT